MQNFVFKNDTTTTTKLMNHLGGKWPEWVMLSGFPGFTVGSHLWMATQEQSVTS